MLIPNKFETELAFVDDLGRVEYAVHFARYEEFVTDVLLNGGIVVEFD